jgi:predicted house-cleaning noncanonical NTP pyrophosphatase (MazG superfamily)
MTIYNKLVRDRIPEVIESTGGSYEVRMLSDEEFVEYLHSKLNEEFQEYQEYRNVTELADFLEIIYVIAVNQGLTIDRLEQLRLRKRPELGGFDRKLLLISTGDTRN